jgi:hypothetical protein
VTRSEMGRLALKRLANQVPNASTMRNAGAKGAVAKAVVSEYSAEPVSGTGSG